MTTLELEKEKFINDIDSLETLNKLKQYLKRIKKSSPPCQFSLDEIKGIVAQGVIDANNGLGTSQEDMRKLHPKQ